MVALLAACAAPQPAATSLLQSSSLASVPLQTAPSTTPPTTATTIAPQPPTIAGPTVASWETSHPFSLAPLVARRLRQPLIAADRRQIDIATAHALVDEGGDLHRWQAEEPARKGIVRLVRRSVAEDGRICARLHHEHQFGRRTVRGSILICRQRGDSTAPWQLDEVRWIRLGNELARAADVPRVFSAST